MKNAPVSRVRIGAISLVFIIALALPGIPSGAAIKAGSVCKKAQQVRVVKGVKFTCVKSGKKLVWRKSAVTAEIVSAAEVTPSPSPSPIVSATPSPSPSIIEVTVPQGFADLFENRKGIAYGAWKKTAEIIAVSPDRGIKLDIELGPNTKPHFEDYEGIVNLLGRAFPNRSLPPRTLVIQFNYTDMDWASAKFLEKVPSEEVRMIQGNEKNDFIKGNCQAPNSCNGARQQTLSTGLSVIAHGVVTLNPLDTYTINYFKTGWLEVHEYFHGIQRVPMLNKDLGPNGWPHAWFSEGSADWVQNAVVNYRNFTAYERISLTNCNGTCALMSEAALIKFFSEANGWNVPDGLGSGINYSLGSTAIEILVALKGPDSILALYEAMSTRLSFAQAFEKVYGIAWKDAIPILAKTIYANNKNL
jgi:hypothetical protein